MGRLVLRGFAQRKLRALLTGIAIALGVALMAGTYILTDTINHSFANIFGTAFKNESVVVSQSEKLGRGSASEVSPIDEETVEQVRKVPGVAVASGAVFSEATFLTTSRKRLAGGGAPSFVSGEQPQRFNSFTTAQGHFPKGPGEVALDESTAERHKLKLGDKILIAGATPAQSYTIVGITKYAGSQSFGGAGVATLTMPQAQHVIGEPGHFDSISVAAKPGVSASQLRNRVRAALPSSLTVRTGAQEAGHQTKELEHELGFLRTFLLVFAYVALVVGAFIIFNTFSITVAQRTREFGLLRTLGASRTQIMRSVVLEGLLLGVLGAVAGLFIGLALAPALDQLFKAFGADLPDSGTILESRTVIVSLLVGIVVTVLAGFFPALRATRVPPIAAMREGVSIPPRPIPSRRRLIGRFVAGLIVIVFVVPAVFHSHTILPILLAVWVVRGLVLVSRVRRAGKPRNYRVIPALGRTIGLIVSWRGITGRLARENSVRQPGRTLVTALALTVGLGLVAFISVLAAGTKATIDHAVDKSFAGNLIVENGNGTEGGGIPAAIAPAVRKVEGVGSVTAVAFSEGRVRNLAEAKHPVIAEKASVTAIEPQSFSALYQPEWQQGNLATLRSLSSSETVVSKEFAEKNKLKVGQSLSVLTPTGQKVTLQIKGIVKETVGLLTDLTIPRTLASEAFGQREDGVDFVAYASGADVHNTRAGVKALLSGSYPQTKSQTAAEFKEEQSKNVNQFLLLVYVLLALSVIVSLFGIVNTLILSIYERTHELGMMRAIGTSRRQIRQMIRYESVITGLIGGVFGIVIGLVGSILVVTLALSGSGYVMAIPVGTLIALLVISGIAGLLAAQLPARRAAKLDVLRAVSSE
ncbi:MAG TPA: ABC transporter permease [Solirubrobacteraceae bacterium]|jgi:putative ABC transport system permease protein